MMPLAIGPVPLVAAGLDWLEALLPVLFIAFWILSQVVAVVKKVAGGGEPAKPAAQPVRRPRPVAADRVGPGGLEDEIREFLRREMPDVRTGPTPSPSSPPKPPPVRPRPAPQVAERAKAMPQPTPARVSGDSIAEKVREDFAKGLEHLSTPLTADQALVSPQPAGVAATASPAADFVRSLRSPSTLRQLIVVREILERPVDRW